MLDANRRPCPYQRSIDVTRFGDTTPRIIRETGARSHTELGDRGPAVRDYEEGNGASVACLRWRDGRVPDLSQLSQIWWYRFGTVFSQVERCFLVICPNLVYWIWDSVFAGEVLFQVCLSQI